MLTAPNMIGTVAKKHSIIVYFTFNPTILITNTYNLRMCTYINNCLKLYLLMSLLLTCTHSLTVHQLPELSRYLFKEELYHETCIKKRLLLDSLAKTLFHRETVRFKLTSNKPGLLIHSRIYHRSKTDWQTLVHSTYTPMNLP